MGGLLGLNWKNKDEKYSHLGKFISTVIFTLLYILGRVNDYDNQTVMTALLITALLAFINLCNQSKEIINRVVYDSDLKEKEIVGTFEFNKDENDDRYVILYSNSSGKLWYEFSEDTMRYNVFTNNQFKELPYLYLDFNKGMFDKTIYKVIEITDVKGKNSLIVYRGKDNKYYVMSYDFFKENTKNIWYS